MTNPYALSDERLISEFASACRRSGFSNSGLVISFSAGSDASYASYLESVLLARLQRETPPFQPGQVVAPKEMETKPFNNGWKRSSHPRQLPEKLTVERVYYLGNQKWLLRFKEWTEATADKESVMEQDGVDTTWHPLNFDPNDFRIFEEEKTVA